MFIDLVFDIDDKEPKKPAIIKLIYIRKPLGLFFTYMFFIPVRQSTENVS